MTDSGRRCTQLGRYSALSTVFPLESYHSQHHRLRGDYSNTTPEGEAGVVGGANHANGPDWHVNWTAPYQHRLGADPVLIPSASIQYHRPRISHPIDFSHNLRSPERQQCRLLSDYGSLRTLHRQRSLSSIEKIGPRAEINRKMKAAQTHF